jgi:hypothetical protein
MIELGTNRPYGHVIAVNPLGEVYAMPLHETLIQVAEFLRPTENTNIEIFLELSHLVDINPPIPTEKVELGQTAHTLDLSPKDGEVFQKSLAMGRDQSYLTYEYIPMDPSKQQIRVLTLYPAEDRQSIIRCSLTTTSLQDFPEYSALSYVWGSSETTHTIEINGRCFQILQNLRSALEDIRSQSHARKLWVDAICINQSDRGERSLQTLLMNRVYAQATEVLAWVDVEINPSMEPFTEIKSLEHPEDLADREPAFWYPILEVLANRYWVGLWTQRQVIAADYLVVHCRRHELIGSDLWNFMEALSRLAVDKSASSMAWISSVNEFLSSTFGDDTFDISRLQSLVQRRVTFVLNESKGSHTNVVQKFHESTLGLYLNSGGLQVFDPRDRLYGFLGTGLDSESEDTIPDYSIPFTEVYAHFVQRFIQTQRNLDFLCYVTPSGGYKLEKHTANAPSWLLQPTESVPFSTHVGATSSAGGQSSASARIEKIGHRFALKASGIRVDRIQARGKHRNLGTSPIIKWYQNMKEIFFRMNPKLPWNYPWDAEILVDYFLASAGQALREEWVDQVPLPLSIADIYNHACKVMETTHRWDLTLLDFFGDDLIKRLHTSDVGIGQGTSLLMDDQRFFGTESGRFGLAQSCPLLREDEIWVLFGCPVPLILRKRGDSEYVLISHAWVSGLMEGQACESGFHVGLSGADNPGLYKTQVSIV